MTPIGELRLAIPLALTKLELPLIQAYLLAIIGNLVPVLFLLLFLDPVSKFLMAHFSTWQKFFNWLFERTRNKLNNHYKIYGYLAIVIFVAIPLPLTGAWTGSVAAYLLGVPFGKAFGLIALGVIISATIVTLASLGLLYLY